MKTEIPNLIPIPEFPLYGVTPDGLVYRMTPAGRGACAGMIRQVTPTIHPRGHQWTVLLYNESGVRKRVRVAKLLELVFEHNEKS